MSQYKIIDGEKYEKSLIDLARSRTEGKGDGRISVQDMKDIVEAAKDGVRVTTIEVKTLYYIIENFPITDAVTDWLKDIGALIEDRSFRGKMNRVLGKYRVGEMNRLVDPRMVEAMNLLYPGEVSFHEALDIAINRFLNDKERDRPLYEVEVIISDQLDFTANDLKEESKHKYWEVMQAFLKERMNAGAILLLPVWQDLTRLEADDINIPDISIDSRQNWVFELEIVTGDHNFFAIVDRSGKEAPYLYGYN